MDKTRVLLKLSLTLFLLLSGCSTIPTAISEDAPRPLDPEEYNVYSTVIDVLFAGESFDRWVIRDQTSWEVFKGVEPSKNIQTLGRGWPSLREKTRRDYEIKNRRLFRLEERFALAKPYILINEKEFKVIFNSSVGWQTFFNKYKGAQGIMTFSRVGFSPGKDQALVYVANDKSWFYGSGHYFLLSREKKGDWRIEGELTAWKNR